MHAAADRRQSFPKFPKHLESPSSAKRGRNSQAKEAAKKPRINYNNMAIDPQNKEALDITRGLSRAERARLREEKREEQERLESLENSEEEEVLFFIIQ